MLSILLLVSVWDSSAKAQTALMTGNLNSLGNFDECISVQNIFNHDSYFSGQHCLATLKLENISASDAMGKTFQQIMEEEEEINMGVRRIFKHQILSHKIKLDFHKTLGMNSWGYDEVLSGRRITSICIKSIAHNTGHAVA
jgi:hypothetical protein